MSGYHLYLTTERDNVLAKYEYAISTARILDAHALHKYKEEVKSARDSLEMSNAELRDQGLRTIELAPIKFSQLYQKVFSDYINSEHLKANGDADVLNVLKRNYNWKMICRASMRLIKWRIFRPVSGCL